MKKQTYRIRALALLLTLTLLCSVGIFPTDAAEDGGEPMQSATHLPDGEAYRTVFTTKQWHALPDTGVLLTNDTDGITLDILDRGAGFTAQMLPYDGQTPCNALYIVLENRSACTEMQLSVTYGTEDTGSTQTVRIEPQFERSGYYVYLDAVEEIHTVTVQFPAVSDGAVVLHSFSRISFYDQLKDSEVHGSISECYYDPATANVVISGRLRSESVVRFSGGNIVLYRLNAMGRTVDYTAEPLQTLKINNRFTFIVPTANFAARASRYALVLIDAQGNRTLLCEPCYPSLLSASDSLPEAGKPAYKGIDHTRTYDALRAYAGAAIVDVYLDELTSTEGREQESFSFDETYFSFDRAYLHALSEQILPLCRVGSEVYLRLLVRANANGYALPYTVSDSQGGEAQQYLAIAPTTLSAQRAYCATLSYLLEKLSADGVQLAGIVLGKSVDRSLYTNYAGMIPLQQYLQTVTFAIMQTENVLHTYLPNATVCLPVSDTAYPSYYTSYDLDGIYATQMLLDGVCRMLDDIGLGAFSFRPLLEMTGIPNELSPVLANQDESGAENIQSIQDESAQPYFDVNALRDAVASYDCAQSDIAVIWTPPTDAESVPLQLSYIYLYYTMRDQSVATLFVAADAAQSELLSELMAQIDTVSAEQALVFAIPYFGEDQINAWLHAGDGLDTVQLYSAVLTQDTHAGYIGRYPYWNFATAVGSMGWARAYGCQSLLADGSSRYGRALRAELSRTEEGGMIQYAFSRAEDFSVCDALSLTLAVTDQKGNLIPAKVRLTLYGADVRIEAGCTLQTGKLTTVTLSGIPLDAADACTAMTLSVQPLLAQEDGNLRVYLLDIDGMSRTLDDDALEAAILEKREERAKQESRRPMGAYPVLLLTALVLLTAVGAVFCLRGSPKIRRR